MKRNEMKSITQFSDLARCALLPLSLAAGCVSLYFKLHSLINQMPLGVQGGLRK
jgi:hypothetical protein